nr:hypothetical protein CFP56_11908 [Quercus suber]
MCAQPVDNDPARWYLSDLRRPSGRSRALCAPLSIPAQGAAADACSRWGTGTVQLFRGLHGRRRKQYIQMRMQRATVGRQLDVISHYVSATPAVRWPDANVIATIITKSPNADRQGLPAAKRSV